MPLPPNLNEPHASLHESPGEQAAAAEIGADRIIEAIQFPGGLRFAADIGGLRSRHLHAEGKLVGFDTRGQFRIVIARIQMLPVQLLQGGQQIAR
jgi:hypothetical protein